MSFGQATDGHLPAHDERLRFVARLLEGDSMSEMCGEFGISRKTGYKIRAGQRR